MKKIILLLFLVSFLTSCGPHRMRCGAYGVYKSSESQFLLPTNANINATVKI